MFFLPYLAVAVPTFAVVYKLVPKIFYQTALGNEETNALECCNILSNQLPGQVHFPGSVIYGEQQKYYSLEQSTLAPSCRVSPRTTSDVSRIVKVASAQKCTFSVKCGGHMAWSGASNIGPSGFTVDLGELDKVQISEDHNVVSVAAGTTWTDVYNVLSPYNLTVVGGRSAGVGVGGFLAHGGISFLSLDQGFGSDNVVKYEVVLADGAIVTASPSKRPDLYWALKLGSTNYGIVTRFDLTTFPLQDIWGGAMLYDINLGPPLLEHLTKFTANINNEPTGMTAVGMAYNPQLKQYLIWAPVMYYKPVASPPLFAGMSSFEPFYNSVKVRSLVDMAEEVARSAPGGGRAMWFSHTLRLDSQLPWDAYLQGRAIFDSVLDLPGASWALTLQPINSGMLKAGARNGGGPLGVPEREENLLLLLGSIFWDDSKDDAIMKEKMAEYSAWIETTARERGLLHSFIYMNYAFGTQNVYDGLGAGNREKMVEIKERYDPENVFGKYWRGGFKL